MGSLPCEHITAYLFPRLSEENPSCISVLEARNITQNFKLAEITAKVVHLCCVLLTECCGVVVRTPLYLGDTGFKSQPTEWLTQWLIIHNYPATHTYITCAVSLH
jgi:hypothetical protein